MLDASYRYSLLEALQRENYATISETIRDFSCFTSKFEAQFNFIAWNTQCLEYKCYSKTRKYNSIVNHKRLAEKMPH